MSRTNGTGVPHMGPMAGRKAGTTPEAKSQVTRTDVANKIRCRWGAPVPEWLWAWAGMVKVEKEKDENDGDRQSGRVTMKEDT
jgi:hypothetical protein